MDGVEDDFFPHLSLMYGADLPSTTQDGVVRSDMLIQYFLHNEIVRERQGGGGVEVVGVRGFEVGDVLLVKCQGRPEGWEVLGQVSLGQ